MAEKGFGVKEVNLIGASGTPTITSPNNLNLNANNVAISTNVSIGGTLTVTGNVSVGGTLTYEDVTNIDSVGIVTAREGVFIPDSKKLQLGNASGNADLEIYHDGSNSYIKDAGTGGLFIQGSGGGAGITLEDTDGNDFIKCIDEGTGGTVELYKSGNKKLNTTTTGVTVTGTLTATTFSGSGASLTNLPVSDSDIQVAYTVTANGSSAYRFAGNGVVSTADDPDLYLIRGQKYRFINNSGGSHPFQIRVASGGAAYSTGVTNNGAASGNIDFAPTYDSPAQLVYQCTSHSGMVGNIYLRDAAGGNTNVGVTTFVADTTFNGVKVGRGAGNDDKSTIVGYLALASNTTGYRNTAIGNQALNANLSGISNTAVGTYSNRKNTTGNSNTSVGNWTMLQNINGHSNSVFGASSLGICTSGFRNTILGYNSGSAIVDGSGNTIIGCNITGSTSLTDTVIIGAGNGIERLRILSSGNVGIGLTIPDQKLHIYEQSGSSQAYLHVQNNRARNAAIKFTTTQGSWLVGQGIGVDADRFMVYDTQQRMGIDSSGNMTLNTGNLVMGTSGKGIDFSVTANTSAGSSHNELLDDYEEGQWSPGVTFGGTGATVTSNGKYTKIGNLVHITYQVTIDNLNSGTGSILCTNLPFTPSMNPTYSHGIVQGNSNKNLPSTAGSTMPYIQTNTTEFRILYDTPTSHGDVQHTMFPVSTTFYGNGTYFTTYT